MFDIKTKIFFSFVTLLFFCYQAEACECVKIKVEGSSMFPILEDGQIISAQPLCGLKPWKNSIVVYESAGKNFIKMVRGIPGDILSVGENAAFLNGQEILNSNGFKYEWNNRLKMLKLYEGTIPEDTYLVMGESSGRVDSSKYGLIHKMDIKRIVKTCE